MYDSGHDSGGRGKDRHERRHRKKSSEKDREGNRESSRKTSLSSHDKDKERKKERERERGGGNISWEHGGHDSKHSPSTSKPTSTSSSSKSRRSSGGSVPIVTHTTAIVTSGSKMRTVRSRGQRLPSHSPPPLMGLRSRGQGSPSHSPPPLMGLRSRGQRSPSHSPPPLMGLRSRGQRSPSHSPPPLMGLGGRQRSRSRSPLQDRIVEIAPDSRAGGVATGKGSVQTTRGGFVSSFRQGCPPIGSQQESFKRSPSPPLNAGGRDVSYRVYNRRSSSQSGRY